MKRCDKPANILYPNGFRACSECASTMPDYIATRESNFPTYNETPYGPCDAPAESRAEFWARYGKVFQ